MTFKTSILTCITMGLFGCSNVTEPNQWTQLFNGKDLSNWIVKDHSVTHLINGKIALQYSRPTIDGKDDIVQGQSLQYKEDGRLLESGYIALQSEGQPIEFKNVQIKELD